MSDTLDTYTKLSFLSLSQFSYYCWKCKKRTNFCCIWSLVFIDSGMKQPYTWLYYFPRQVGTNLSLALEKKGVVFISTEHFEYARCCTPQFPATYNFILTDTTQPNTIQKSSDLFPLGHTSFTLQGKAAASWNKEGCEVQLWGPKENRKK